MLIVLFAGAVFLYFVGVDALEGRNEFQFFADSRTYHAMARGDVIGLGGLSDSIAVAGNFLGPLLLLSVTADNYYLVMAVNTLLFYLSVASIAKSLRFDSLRFSVLLLINPLTVSNLLAVNKEIFSLVFVALLLRALVGGSLISWAAAALVSVLVRWQLTVFLVMMTLLISQTNPLRRYRLATLVFLLVGVSVLYVQLSAAFESIRFAFETGAEEHEGSGLYEWLQGWQERGAYLFVFPLKAMHVLFALGLRVDRLVAPVDIYNDVWQLLHSTMTLVLFVALLKQRLFRLPNDLIYLSILYIAIFALSPIYSPRYSYPLYVLWAAALVARTPVVSLMRTQLPVRDKRAVRRRLLPSVRSTRNVPA